MENNIGEARRNYSLRNGKFTQSDAAKFFGVSLSTYKKWEQGQGMMNGEQLKEIAMKYDTTVDYLLDVQGVNYAVVEMPEDDSTLSSDELQLLYLYRKIDDDFKQPFARILETLTNPDIKDDDMPMLLFKRMHELEFLMMKKYENK